MPLTVYEKNGVKGGMNAVAEGFIKYNVLNVARTPKATKLVPDPKPEFVVELTEWTLRGDKQLVAALQETAYNDGKNISFRDKSPYAPTIFDSNKEQTTGDKFVPDGQAIKEGTPVKVHISTFDTPLNVGCGFDALMMGTPFDQVPLQDISSVSADVFDQFNDQQAVTSKSKPVDWDAKK